MLYGLYGTLQVEELAVRMTQTQPGGALFAVAIFGLIVGIGVAVRRALREDGGGAVGEVDVGLAHAHGLRGRGGIAGAQAAHGEGRLGARTGDAAA